MDLTVKKKGRPPGSKNVLSLPEKANKAFNHLYQTFDQDLTKATPNERITATIQLAGILLNTKQTKNEKITQQLSKIS